jgi:hypothetical protein
MTTQHRKNEFIIRTKRCEKLNKVIRSDNLNHNLLLLMLFCCLNKVKIRLMSIALKLVETLFLPYFPNKTTLIARRHHLEFKPYYLIIKQIKLVRKNKTPTLCALF